MTVGDLIAWLTERDMLPVLRRLEAALREEHATFTEVLTKRRTRRNVRARGRVFAILHGEGLSYPEIGELFGYDHTTVINAAKKAQQDRGETP